MRLLMELRPALEGFAGIPQETRLLFSSLHCLEEDIHVDGLLNTFRNPHQPRLAGRDRISRVYEQGKYILDIYDPWVPKTRLARLLSFPARLPRHASLFLRSALGVHYRLWPFDSEIFYDFIWQRVFAKTLPVDLLKQIITRSYFMAPIGWYEMHRAGRLIGFYPTLDTSKWDFALMQTPFPAQVSENTKLIIRYHDAIPLYLPQHISDGRRHMANHFHALRANAKKAWFVCTSPSVMQDLLRLLPEVTDRTTVIPDIVSDAFFPDPVAKTEVVNLFRRYVAKESRPRFSERKEEQDLYSSLQRDSLKYLIAVGTLEPRKNYARLLSAWEEIYTRTGGRLKLVIVGEMGWQWNRDAEHDQMLKWSNQGALFHLARMPPHALRKLYSSSLAVVCPSVSEGFDYSGIEGMQCGALVLASDIPTHRAVYSDAALYFNPYSTHELIELIEKVCSFNEGNETTAKLKERGSNLAKQFSAAAIVPKWHEFLTSIRRVKIQSFY